MRGQIFDMCVLRGVDTGTRVLSPALRVGLGLVSATASPLEEPGRLQICGIAESRTWLSNFTSLLLLLTPCSEVLQWLSPADTSLGQF